MKINIIYNIFTNREETFINSIHVLRGIAAIAVCMNHFAYTIPDFLPSENILRLIGQYGWLGVDAFFVISGFIIPYSMYIQNYKTQHFHKYLLRRFIRIEIPYLASILIVLVIWKISTLSTMYSGVPFQLNLNQILLHIGYLIPFSNHNWLNPIYWTLALEFQFYIICSLIFWLISSKDKMIMPIVFILLFSLSGYIITNHSLIFKYAPLFCIGIILFWLKIKTISLNIYLMLLIVISIISYDIVGLSSSLTGIIASAFIIFYNLNLNMKLFGNISYSLYLIHIPIGVKLLNFSKNYTNIEWQRSLLIITTLLVVMSCSVLYYYLVEKPSIVLSKKIRY